MAIAAHHIAALENQIAQYSQLLDKNLAITQGYKNLIQEQSQTLRCVKLRIMELESTLKKTTDVMVDMRVREKIFSIHFAELELWELKKQENWHKKLQ